MRHTAIVPRPIRDPGNDGAPSPATVAIAVRLRTLGAMIDRAPSDLAPAGVDADRAEGADPEAWSLEDVYDDETVALIERAARPPLGTEGSAPRGRSGMTGLLMAGMMTGVAEVLDPDRLQPEMVEFSPDVPDPETMPVQFVYVHGDPKASRLIVRPWLLARRHHG
jgi:hypothetical protein